VVFSGTRASSIHKTDHHDITEILLNVVLNTINLKKQTYLFNTYIYLYVEVLGVEVVVLLVVFLKMQILHKPDVMWLGLCLLMDLRQPQPFDAFFHKTRENA
jgi:hypothetical protein